MTPNFPPDIYFISGIDTNIGKTYATGYLAQQILKTGQHIITQKLIQTGCQHQSDDILTHRKIMGIPLQHVDHQGLTAPQIFAYPASPHLASQLANQPLNLDMLTQATQQLKTNYPIIFIEGAGGLMTPLTPQLLTIDYLAQHHYPIILVTSSKLGSINHTLLSLNAIKQYQLPLYALAFNAIHDQDPIIAQDTRQFLQQYLTQFFTDTIWIEIPHL